MKMIDELQADYADILDNFSNDVRYELISILAYSVLSTLYTDKKLQLEDLEGAIFHIVQQKGSLSYYSLSTPEKTCVDVFANQILSQQEHIVFSKQNLVDTLRILDAHTETTETKEKEAYSDSYNNKSTGFISVKKLARTLWNSMVSLKAGEKNG